MIQYGILVKNQNIYSKIIVVIELLIFYNEYKGDNNCL